MRLPRTARKAVRAKSKHGKAAHAARASSTNPSCTRHREAVNARRNTGAAWASPGPAPAVGGPMLTQDLLTQFDSEQREAMMDQMSLRLDPLDDAESVGGALTFRSLASNLTQCSNPSFERVLRHWGCNSEQQKAVLAVLAGVTQILKENSGSESNVEYFALLMNAMETFDDIENLTAVAFLLKLVINKVSEAVLRREFARVSKNLLAVLTRVQRPSGTTVAGSLVSGAAKTARTGATAAEKTAGSAFDASLVKSVLTCLGVLLRAQDWSVWSAASTHAVFQPMLAFAADQRSRVRKACHLAVTSVLRTGEQKGRPHPAGADTIRHIIRVVMTDDPRSRSASESPKSTLWTLSLLGSVLPFVSASSVQEACERLLLPLMALPSQPMVRLHAIRALHGLFTGFPTEDRLPSDRNAMLLTALYDMRPPSNSEDVATMKAWLTTARAGLLNLLRRQRPCLVAPHLSKLFPLCMDLLASTSGPMRSAACHAGLRLLDDVLRELFLMTEAHPPEEMAEQLNRKEVSRLLVHLLSATRAGLGYQFVEAWGLVLKLIAGVLNIWGQASASAAAEGGSAAAFWAEVDAGEVSKAVRACVGHLVSMRDDGGSAVSGAALEGDLDRCLGVVVAALGPEAFLRLVPLNMAGEEVDLTRSWVLPLLLGHAAASTRRSRLAFFFEELRPLAERLLKAAAEAEEAGGPKGKLLTTLALQFWSLLPLLASRPQELAEESFVVVEGKKKPTLAHALQILVARLSDRPELRGVILTAIRRLVACEKKMTAEKEAVPHLMARFAKNVVPSLFNLFIELAKASAPVAETGPVLETVRAYMTLAEPQLVDKWFFAAKQRMEGEDVAESGQLAFTDLLVSMAPFLSESSLVQVIESECLTLIESAECGQSQQKKAYRMLEVVLEATGDTARTYVDANLVMLLSRLTGSLAVCQEAARKPRLRSLTLLLARVLQRANEIASDDRENTLPIVLDLLAEAIMCMRATNADARRAAKSLLVQITAVWHCVCKGRNRRDEAGRAESLTEVLKRIMVGTKSLGPEDSEEAAHRSLVMLDALLALIQSPKHKPLLQRDHVKEIVDYCANRLLSSSRLTVARGGMKGLVQTLTVTPTSILPLSAFMAALEAMREEHRHALRFDVKSLLLRLMKRLGTMVLLQAIPDFLRFPFVKIAKTEIREEKRRERKRAELRQQRRTRAEVEADEEEEEEGAMEEEAVGAGMLPKRRQPQTLDDLLDDSEASDMETEAAPSAVKKGKKEKKKRAKEGVWLEEAPGEVLDLMDSAVAQRVHTKAPSEPAKVPKKKAEPFAIAEDGRLIIADSEDDEEDEKNGDDSEEEMGKYEPGGRGIHRAMTVRPWQTKVRKRRRREPGEEFRSARAGGDMKKSQKADPFAYLALRGVSKRDLAAVTKKKKKGGRIAVKGRKNKK